MRTWKKTREKTNPTQQQPVSGTHKFLNRVSAITCSRSCSAGHSRVKPASLPRVLLGLKGKSPAAVEQRFRTSLARCKSWAPENASETAWRTQAPGDSVRGRECQRDGEAEPGGRAGSSRPRRGGGSGAAPWTVAAPAASPCPAPAAAGGRNARPAPRPRRRPRLNPLPRPDRNAPIVNTIKKRWSAPSVPRTYRPLHPRRRAGYELSEHKANGEPTGCPGSAPAPDTPRCRRGAQPPPRGNCPCCPNGIHFVVSPSLPSRPRPPLSAPHGEHIAASGARRCPATTCPGPRHSPARSAPARPPGGGSTRTFDNNKLNTSGPEPVPVEIPVSGRGWGNPAPRRRLIKFFPGKGLAGKGAGGSRGAGAALCPAPLWHRSPPFITRGRVGNARSVPHSGSFSPAPAGGPSSRVPARRAGTGHSPPHPPCPAAPALPGTRGFGVPIASRDHPLPPSRPRAIAPPNSLSPRRGARWRGCPEQVALHEQPQATPGHPGGGAAAAAAFTYPLPNTPITKRSLPAPPPPPFSPPLSRLPRASPPAGEQRAAARPAPRRRCLPAAGPPAASAPAAAGSAAALPLSGTWRRGGAAAGRPPAVPERGWSPRSGARGAAGRLGSGSCRELRSASAPACRSRLPL